MQFAVHTRQLTRNAVVALQRSFRHDATVIEPHGQKSKAVDGDCNAGPTPKKGTATCAVDVHPSESPPIRRERIIRRTEVKEDIRHCGTSGFQPTGYFLRDITATTR
jgi:hypothetical protein